MFITKFKFANLITYLGIVFSAVAIMLSYNRRVDMAIMCFILAGICDMFDGTFAKRFPRTEEEREIGIQMDSLADVISFLVVPVAICLSVGMNKWYNYLAYIVYILMGITRLGYFNVFAKKNKNTVITKYPGVAVTYASLIFPLLFILHFYIDINVFGIIAMVVMLVVAFLFMYNIQIPKPGKRAYIVYSLLGIGTLIYYAIMSL